MGNEEHKKQQGSCLEVHRKEPGSLYSVEGCVTLCKKCHGSEPKSPQGRLDLARGSHRLALAGDVGAQLQFLADREDRPLYWQAQRIIIEALKKEGLWPPPEEKKGT